MKKWLLIILLLVIPTSVIAHDSEPNQPSINLKAFAQQYFDTMVATQAPNATEQELERFLALLTDDVGHSHLPYVIDDSRLPDGKQAMRKGMMFYLGVHTEYNAELIDVFVFNDSAIAIRYKKSAKGIHPQNNQPIAYTETMMEVLEIEEGKVAVIRKYHE